MTVHGKHIIRTEADSLEHALKLIGWEQARIARGADHAERNRSRDVSERQGKALRRGQMLLRNKHAKALVKMPALSILADDPEGQP